MPYTINWYIPNQIIYSDFCGEVTLRELSKYNDEMTQILETAASRIHVIVNTTQVTNVSVNPRDIVQTLSHLTHPQIGWGVVVQTSRFVRFLASMVMQLRQVRVRYVGDLPSAADFLEQVDDTIHWEQVDSSLLL